MVPGGVAGFAFGAKRVEAVPAVQAAFLKKVEKNLVVELIPSTDHNISQD